MHTKNATSGNMYKYATLCRNMKTTSVRYGDSVIWPKWIL